MSAPAELAPDGVAELAQALAEADAHGRPVRIMGAGTKAWGTPAPDAEDALALRTGGLSSILAHDPGDMTASLQAGVPLAEAQAAFAEQGQTLSLDPPLGGPHGGAAATIGGIVASGESGPLAHRHGGPRDLVVGASFALADGTVARSGGTVIKNVAGYDVAKLLCGSFGTLAVILSVNVRLHPLRPTITVRGDGDGPALAAAAERVAGLPAELESLDVRFAGGRGTLLARLAGEQSAPRARRLGDELREAGLDAVGVVEEDAELWAAQRDAQRSARDAVLHLSGPPAALGAVLAAVAAVDGSLVGRTSLGWHEATLAPERIPQLRTGLPAGVRSSLRDCPLDARETTADPWGAPPAPALALMRSIKDAFDPRHTLNPGAFVGAI